MKILLDTNILLWALQDADELGEKARYIIEEPDNDIYYSIATLWEIQIKHMNHPKEMKLNAEPLKKFCEKSGFHIASINAEHIKRLISLQAPKGIDHNDPFDKIMISQAATEGMLFLTRDRKILQYNEPCILGV